MKITSTRPSPLWKLCYYRKAKNYCQLNNEQILDICADKLRRYAQGRVRKGQTAKEVKASMVCYTDILITTTAGYPIPDRTGFERIY